MVNGILYRLFFVFVIGDETDFGDQNLVCPID
jgi:hypothetical protein